MKNLLVYVFLISYIQNLSANSGSVHDAWTNWILEHYGPDAKEEIAENTPEDVESEVSEIAPKEA